MQSYQIVAPLLQVLPFGSKPNFRVSVQIDRNGSKVLKSLEPQNIKSFIDTIVAKGNIQGLNTDRIVNDVYHKLKEINTIADIDQQIISSASELACEHYDYPKIAMYLLIRNLHKSTHDNYVDVVRDLRVNLDSDGNNKPILTESFEEFVVQYHKQINDAIQYERDYDVPLFGFRTLEKSYLKRNIKGNIVERPQHLFMRVAIAIHYQSVYENIEQTLAKIIETYNLLSTGFFTHATPTYFNAGTYSGQLSSCFLMGVADDMEKVGDCWKDSAITSKYGGGVGIHVTRLRCMGSKINSTQGKASGMTIASVFNAISRYAHQGGRPGSFALYIELWHGDIFYFLELKKNTGAETERARDLFLGLTVNDVFMQRVEADGYWSLMCPSKCPKLLDKFGAEFTKIYEEYEAAGKYIRRISARDLWFKILESQIETGIPYMFYKDSTNKKSNQSNIGVINGSNLCIEIMEVSTDEEYAVCNLATICLPKYLEYDENGKPVSFSHSKLYDITRIITRNLNNMIDINYYPLEKTKKSNLTHRPIGIGAQGLADTFMLLKLPFDSAAARDLNKRIFETIYFGFMTESVELAKKFGAYQSFAGSPLSEGKFQFDLWGVTPSGMWDWESLRESVIKFGARNSLGIATPPTASTSQIMGNNECLTGDTKIYSSCGLTTCIEDFEVGNKVIGWDDTNLKKSFSYEKIDKGVKDTIRLTFADGRTIKCTKDHKFLTYDKQWIKAEDIQLNTKIMMGIDGTYDQNYGDEDDYELKAGDYTFTMDTYEERYKTLAFARILGYVLSDGNIYHHEETNNYKVRLYMGSKYDMECVSEDICRLECPPNIEDTGKVYRVNLHSELIKAIFSLENITMGRRTTQEAKIPSFLLDKKCPKSIVREFLAGHFGGDGHRPSLSALRKGRTKFTGIKLAHSIHKDHIDSMIQFMKNINKLMMRLGIPSSTISPPKMPSSKLSNPDTREIRLHVPAGTHFLEKIGFRYCVDKQLKLTVATAYWRYRETVINDRNIVYSNAYNHVREGMKMTEALELSQKEAFPIIKPISKFSLGAYDSFLRYCKHNRETDQHLCKIDIGPADFFREMNCFHWFNHHEYMVDRTSMNLPYYSLKLIGKADNGPAHVWDINVRETHSFIANGIMVHNCIEPITSNIYTRSTMAGDYWIANKYLMKELMDLNMWNSDLIDLIKYYDGSVQHIDFIPDHIKQIYKTVWEIEQNSILEMAAERGAFIDQSQSMNIFMAKNKFYPADHWSNEALNIRLTSCHFRAWELGLKTGMYYLRTKPASEASQFGVDIVKLGAKYKLLAVETVDEEKEKTKPVTAKVCKFGDGKEGCVMCHG